MSTESPINSASNASLSRTKEQTQSTEQSQLSDPIQNDLTISTSQSSKKQTKTVGGDSRQSQKSSTAPTPSTTKLASSPQISPTKSTPTKSKNKRTSKKRSANNKKQQQFTAIDKNHSSRPGQETPTDMAQTPTTIPVPSNEDQKQNDSEMHKTGSPTRATPSPLYPSKEEHETNDKNADLVQPKDSPIADDDENQQSSKILPQPKDRGEHVLIDPNNGGNLNDTNSWRRKLQENRGLREQLKLRDTQLHNFADRIKQQINRIQELEASLVNTTRTCSQFEKLLQQELTNRSRLETENDSLKSTVARLRSQISAFEKDRSANNELIRVLNATLMERETELSILKLKMTRMQTNAPTNQNKTIEATPNSSAAKQDSCKAFTMVGRSNSEFSRNSYIRSSMMAEAVSARSSTSQLQQSIDRDASVWASVPVELTPSKRPVLSERNSTLVYDHNIYSNQNTSLKTQSSTPLVRDRRYKTLPRSMKSPQKSDTASQVSIDQQQTINSGDAIETDKSRVPQPACLVTNLDDSNTTSQSSGNQSEVNTNLGSDSKQTNAMTTPKTNHPNGEDVSSESRLKDPTMDDHCHKAVSHYSEIAPAEFSTEIQSTEFSGATSDQLNKLPAKSPSTPVKISLGLKKIFEKFKRSDSASESHSKTDLTSTESSSTPAPEPFQRCGTRSTMVVPSTNLRAQLSPRKAIDFQTNKPFAEWDTNMLVDWLTMIGLSMYANNCRRWVKCGAHIMNATPAEVDKGLGITNHLHRKKLRLAISELNGDCDKITKAASKLDYLWVARWLDDIGLPQYKEAFIKARIDGRVLNYLTIEDLVSMGVKSVLHHSSIKCGIRVLRSINFDLQLLKRRATAEELEQMSHMCQSISQELDGSTCAQSSKISSDRIKVCTETDVSLWTCHRVMEWLRMIDFAEFAPNLRGSGVHGGLIIYEDAFNSDTMGMLLSIPSSRTLLRRHLSSFFENIIGKDLLQRKLSYKEQWPSQALNPSEEIKIPKKSQIWFGKSKVSKVTQDGMDVYLCPMYPVEPQIVKSPLKIPESSHRGASNLPRIPESVNV